MDNMVMGRCPVNLVAWLLPGTEGDRPIFMHHVTRRAFLALRVIQRQGKFGSKGLVENWCK